MKCQYVSSAKENVQRMKGSLYKNLEGKPTFAVKNVGRFFSIGKLTMKIAVIADTHIHPFTSFGVGTGSGNSRVQVSLDALDQVLNYCKSSGITTLIHAGDLFHARDHQRFQVFNAVHDKLLEMSKHLTIHLIAGNHDIVDRQGTLSIHSLRSDNYRGIMVWPSCHTGEAGSYEYETFGGADPLTFIPFTNDFEGLNKLLSNLSPHHYIIGHLDIREAAIGSTMFPSDKGLDRKLLHKFKAVLLGHYHRHQSLGGNAHYVGSLTPVDFGDKGQSGGFCILDTETGQISRVPIKCPQFVEVDQASIHPTVITGNYVRVLGDPKMNPDLDLRAAKAYEWIPRTKEPKSESRIADIDQLNIPEMMKKYVEVRKPSGLDTDKLLGLGNELLHG